MNQLQVGQEFLLTIKRLGINGEGVGFYKRKVVFVPGALPEEVAVVQVTAINSGHAEAKIKKIRKQSPARIKPLCPVYEQCGGCQLQHMTYEEQLKQKREVVIQTFERYSKIPIDSIDFRETIGMDNPWHYRNKSQLRVGKERNRVTAGLYAEDSQRIIDISDCPIQHEQLNNVTKKVKKILEDMNISIYHERKRTGLVRTIVVRVGVKTGQLQLVLVTTKREIPKREQFIRKLQQALPEVTSFMQNVNGGKTSLIFGREMIHLAGKKAIQERLGTFSFDLSAKAFFQLNPLQTVQLYDEVKRAAQLTGKERVVDAYCGVGTIGLWLAKDAKEVRGMDITKESIADAKKNAKNHGFTHMTYEVGKAEVWMPKWTKEGFRPDVVVVDPPRTGCDDNFIQTVLRVSPKRIVYASCNPSTMARDIAKLTKKYQLKYVQTIDMFPQTARFEMNS